MAIDRGPWNALVDDDGSNLVGSVWNKDKIKTVLLDPIDAMTGNYVLLTTGGTVHNLDCGLVGPTTFVVCAPTTDLTLTGLLFATVPRIGDRVTIQNQSTTALVSLAHVHAGSTTKFLNLATSAPTPLGAWGSAMYVYYAGYWILTQHEQGAWITPPFNAAHWGGSLTMTAGMIVADRFRLQGRTLLWAFNLLPTFTAPSALTRTPYGFTPAASGSIGGVSSGADAGGLFTGFWRHDATTLVCYRDNGGGTFAAGAARLTVQGVLDVA